MRIEAVDAFYLRMPQVRDIGDGSQDAILIRVSAGGFEGWGECEAAPLPTIAALVAPLSHSACHPVLASVLGEVLEGAESIRAINARVRERSADLLQADHALSGVDIALWDLLGKVRGQSVWSIFCEENLPKTAYASQLFGDSPEQTYSRANRLAQGPFTAAKFGWGPIGKGGLREDREQIMAAREGLGKDRLLMIDTGCAFGHDIERAVARIELFKEARAAWWEEPFASGALEEYACLAELSDVPLAGGEGAHNVDQARHLIDYGKVRFIQIDAGRVGGITSARDVAKLCQGRDVRYVNHTFTSNLALSASLQPYADVPNSFAEVPVDLSSLGKAIAGPPWQLDENGCIQAPCAPGLGLSPDLRNLEPYIQSVDISINGRQIWPPPDK